ncbi:hypothetical protein LTR62_000926 [Meristemomyces frigidus]|uniref:Proteasome assembly chaperone 3 n=1 Tax=Meristemomyces frigidus TaxID=1508187 RepID=A0AAN7YMN9_9PEZI|nr:hypothetical protein LTR62_000926 [Meristemomyces frigidus]
MATSALAAAGQNETSITPSPFPAPSKTTSGLCATHPTTITRISFTDKLLLTISQSGRLSHWVHVPLSSAANVETLQSTAVSSGAAGGDNALLPRSDLTATTVLGGTKEGAEVVGCTLAVMIASAILVKRPGEARLLVLGLGLVEGGGMGRREFEEVVGLVLDVL